MTRRLSLRRVLPMTAAAAGAAIAAKRAADRREAARFYERVGEPTEPFDRGDWHGGFPGIWHGSDVSETLHAASLEAVRAMLPSPDLHPVRLPGERAVIYVGSLRHDVFTAGGVQGQALLPYGEVLIAALVTRRPAPPLLPFVAPAATGMAAGAFVLHLPVTSRAARDAGRAMGYPKFTADMEFEDSVKMIRTQLSEGGQRILTHTVWPAGRPSVNGSPMTLYSVLDGGLLEQPVPRFGLQRRRLGRRHGLLELGDHEVADELRALDIDPQPFMTAHFSAARLSMPGPHPIGSARPYLGYMGDERELGRYMVTYPGTGPIDLYAPFAPTAGPRGAISELAAKEVDARLGGGEPQAVRAL